MITRIISIFILLFNFVLFSNTFAWENLLEMMDEVSNTTYKESEILGNRFDTKEKLIDALVSINPSNLPSPVYEMFKEEAMKVIKYYTQFFEGTGRWIAPWVQVAEVGLGTDNGGKMLACLVALADIRGLPSFKKTLNEVLKGVKVEESDGLESLTAKFNALKV